MYVYEYHHFTTFALGWRKASRLDFVYAGGMHPRRSRDLSKQKP